MSRNHQLCLIEKRLREHEMSGEGATLCDLLYGDRPMNPAALDGFPADLVKYLCVCSNIEKALDEKE